MEYTGFTSVADLYVKYRPVYPAEVHKEIVRLLDEKLPGPHHQAVDVGCGSGQFTAGLSPYFTHVIGVDISEGQIEQANAGFAESNVRFKLGTFESIPLESGTCDLVTCFTAVHWCEDVEVFYREADRVLRPGGCLVIGGYTDPVLRYGEGSHDVQLNAEMNRLVERISRSADVPMKRCNSGYEGLVLPYTDGKRIEYLSMSKTMNLDDICYYIKSYGAYVEYSMKHANEEENPINVFRKRVVSVTGLEKTPESFVVTGTWNLFILIGRKPTNHV